MYIITSNVFNAYVREARDTVSDKTQLGQKINGYRYAEIAIVAENEKDLKEILRPMELVMEKDLHMKMDSKKKS